MGRRAAVWIASKLLEAGVAVQARAASLYSAWIVGGVGNDGLRPNGASLHGTDRRSLTPGQDGTTRDPYRSQAGRGAKLRHEFQQNLDPTKQSVVLSWASFTVVFTFLRLLTHWIHRGHGPQGGGISVGGRHFHHYNIGIALLSAIGAVGLRGTEKHRHHPAVAVAYGSANALVVDELALLLDLKDVYWSHDGRESVDVAIAVIAAGATFLAGLPFWPHARRILRSAQR